MKLIDSNVRSIASAPNVASLKGLGNSILSNSVLTALDTFVAIASKSMSSVSNVFNTFNDNANDINDVDTASNPKAPIAAGMAARLAAATAPNNIADDPIHSIM